MLEFCGAAVSSGAVNRVASLLQLMKYVRKEPAVALNTIFRSPGQVHSGNRLFVALQAPQEIVGDSSLAQ